MPLSTSEIPDCLIAGAGPTGLTLALELARRGKTVRIFDRSPGPRPVEQSRALGILPPSLVLLEPSGVTTRLLEAGLTIKEARVSRDALPRFAIDIAKGGGKFPFLLSLPQGQTERILIAALEEFGVEPEWNSEVSGLTDVGERPLLSVNQGGDVEEIPGRFVAGCDGVHSVVREKLGIAFEGDRFPATFSLADVVLKQPDPKGVAMVNAIAEGVVARLPLPDGSVRLIGSFPDVEQHPDVAPLIGSTGWKSDFSITFRHAVKLQKGRAFLAGDAAHVHSPVGGRGMNTGIGDAAWLAWLICEARQEEYEDYRLPVARMIISQTRAMTKIISRRTALRRFALDHILPLAMKFSFVQRRAAAQMLAHDMPHPDWID